MLRVNKLAVCVLLGLISMCFMGKGALKGAYYPAYCQSILFVQVIEGKHPVHSEDAGLIVLNSTSVFNIDRLIQYK